MSKETELTVELIALLDNFKETHAALVENIGLDAAYPLWIQPVADPVQARETLKELVLSWSYSDDNLEPGKTIQCNGLAPCSRATFDAVEAVNRSRVALKQQLIKMDRFKVTDNQGGEIEDEIGDENDDDDEQFSNRLSRRAMYRLGYPRFNRRQACRQFAALPCPVLSAGFFWNRYRKTLKLNRQQVQKKLDRLAQRTTIDAAVIQNEYQRFEAIADEVLVQVYPESIHQRVNLYIEKDQREKRIQHYAHTPIFFVTTPDRPLPDKTPLPEKAAEKETRLRRRNITVEQQPYLHLCSLNLHRLLPQYR